MSDKRVDILVAALGDHQVTMTNPSIGTVLISRVGFAKFRDIVKKREIIGPEDKQSDVLVELGECFAAARRCGSDRNGNILLRDKEMRILFVVSQEGRVLLASFDQNDMSRKRQLRKTA